jgi:phage baseplate assembly protein W
MATPSNTPYGIAYPIGLGNSGYFAQTFDVVDQIKTNLRIFLGTKKGERRMNPTFGSSLYEVLFEHSSEELPAIIESVIKEDINRWLPVLEVLDVRTTLDSVDGVNINRVDVQVVFSVSRLGITQAQTLVFSINQSIS